MGYYHNGVIFTVNLWAKFAVLVIKSRQGSVTVHSAHRWTCPRDDREYLCSRARMSISTSISNGEMFGSRCLWQRGRKAIARSTLSIEDDVAEARRSRGPGSAYNHVSRNRIARSRRGPVRAPAWRQIPPIVVTPVPSLLWLTLL